MVLGAKIMQLNDIVKGLNLSHADQISPSFKLSFCKLKVPNELKSEIFNENAFACHKKGFTQKVDLDQRLGLFADLRGGLVKNSDTPMYTMMT